MFLAVAVELDGRGDEDTAREVLVENDAENEESN